ncbi:MAG: type II toxin-antitoxin system VapC family toxin [Cyanobacteriota bacterium]|nr:type II toxin-antitoxin system VapC family toxin [Cyanobacteriota bacterium]
MNAKEQLLQELDRTPEFLIQEVLDFLCFLKLRHSIQLNSPESFSFALHHLQQLGEIGSRQTEVDALELSRLSRSAYDAAYIALAESLNAELWTLDSPLYRNATGLGFPVRLVRTD